MTVDVCSNSVNGLEFKEKSFDEQNDLEVISSSEIVLPEVVQTGKSKDSTETSKWKLIWRKCAGILLTILASFFFGISAVIVKSISEVSVSEMTTYRYMGK